MNDFVTPLIEPPRKQGTAYTPVSLPAPKKLKNPFAAYEQATLPAQQSTPPPRPVGSGGKLTWSERQALAKKRAEEEEASSRAAAAPAVSRAVPPVSSAGRWGTAAAVGGAATVVVAASAARDPEPEEEFVVRASLSKN